jgi:IS605 OrfB family transposase
MKLTLQLKLIPTPEQHTALLETMHAFNAAASYAAEVGFRDHVFSHISLHKRCYRELRDKFGLSSQMAVRAIGKASETFKRDKKRCPVFQPDGAMTYDERILGWKGPAHVSLLTLHGRVIVAMVYGEYQAGYMQRLKGQVDLVYRDGTFYLYATIDVPEDTPIQPTHFLGIDLGITNIATDSDGNSYTGKPIEVVRQRCMTHRQTFQATGTKGAKRRLKKLAGKQARFQRWVNHTISKKLVAYAKDTKAVLVLEELTNIRSRITARAKQRNKQHNWSFRQMREFLLYKTQRAGIVLVFVDPRNTSRTCNRCGYVDKRNRRSQAEFSCFRCGHIAHADTNAAKNLAVRGEVAHPDLIAPRQGQLVFAWQ